MTFCSIKHIEETVLNIVLGKRKVSAKPLAATLWNPDLVEPKQLDKLLYSVHTYKTFYNLKRQKLKIDGGIFGEFLNRSHRPFRDGYIKLCRAESHASRKGSCTRVIDQFRKSEYISCIRGKCREILVLTVFNNSHPQPLFSSMVIFELHRKQVYMPYFLDLALRKIHNNEYMRETPKRSMGNTDNLKACRYCPEN